MLRAPDDAVAAVEAAVSTVDLDTTAADHGGWPMAADALAFLRAVVAAVEPAHVLEFGAGASTVELIRAAAALPRPAAVTSVENDPVVRDAASKALAAVEGVATVQFAPLVARRIDGRHLPVYLLDPGSFASDAPPDVVVVDGPPTMLGGREGAVRQALQLADVGTIVLLDDADRPAEVDALAAVVRTHGTCLRTVPCEGFARGMGALVVTTAVPVRSETDGPTSGRAA